VRSRDRKGVKFGVKLEPFVAEVKEQIEKYK
jgi:hypothetical protein